MNLYQNLFDQYSQGTLPDNIWDKHAKELKALASQPGFIEFRKSDTYFNELWNYIDSIPDVDYTLPLQFGK